MRSKIIEQPNQLQLIIRAGIKPQLDCLVVLAEFGQLQIPTAFVYALSPPAAKSDQ
jgi:hypothetical protein